MHDGPVLCLALSLPAWVFRNLGTIRFLEHLLHAEDPDDPLLERRRFREGALHRHLVESPHAEGAILYYGRADGGPEGRSVESIDIFELRRMDLRAATVVTGFPSVGLVSSIVSNYLINSQQLQQIGILDSVYFPSVALVRGSEPLNTVRIYAGEPIKGPNGVDQLVVFISEFQPPANLIKLISRTILDWVDEQKCLQMICPEGLVIDREEDTPQAVADETAPAEGEEAAIPPSSAPSLPTIDDVYAISCTSRGRQMLQAAKLPLFHEGVITGIAGVMLNEGKIRDFTVCSLLAEAQPNYPDARAAARVVEALDRLLPAMSLDPKPLYQEAEGIESQLRNMEKQNKVIQQLPLPQMYG